MEELEDGQFFLAASEEMRSIRRQATMLSQANVPVLITGESGVGKEVVAQLLHRHSLRAGRQFLKVNCAALPADLLESELFGYEAGAFTGAMKSKPGKFELCDGGTILLDEIGEMSPQLQAKLLHVLQDGSFSRLGARVNTKVNVRVLAATNIDIEQAIADRRFREDLYYRLNAFVIKVPALRERPEEIPYFLNELATRFAITNRLDMVRFPPELIAAAVQYPWPGNLRELSNFVKRYLITRDGQAALAELETKIRPRTAASSERSFADEAAPSSVSGLKSVVRSMKDQTESRMILEVLDQAKWNRRIAAERLQISYKALLYKIRLYNLAASA
ncbi:MAG: sigma-54 dependent transcriptional regulator [Silvibacterium sp.]